MTQKARQLPGTDAAARVAHGFSLGYCSPFKPHARVCARVRLPLVMFYYARRRRHPFQV